MSTLSIGTRQITELWRSVRALEAENKRLRAKSEQQETRIEGLEGGSALNSAMFPRTWWTMLDLLEPWTEGSADWKGIGSDTLHDPGNPSDDPRYYRVVIPEIHRGISPIFGVTGLCLYLGFEHDGQSEPTMTDSRYLLVLPLDYRAVRACLVIEQAEGGYMVSFSGDPADAVFAVWNPGPYVPHETFTHPQGWRVAVRGSVSGVPQWVLI